ncbi:NAD(P)-binding protein [Ideonella sp.]|uniref:NAD(P)-binding protein n=1 Tax=Ideonella sp. TaxID=1929293 RepID=UPI003BB7320B
MAGLSGLVTGCTPAAPVAAAPLCRWVGASVERGHRLRDLVSVRSGTLAAPAVQRRARVLVLGGGVAGLSALRSLAEAGVDDAQLLELEDSVGGNSRGHTLAGMACPLGAHYLPVPGPAAREVGAWLHDIGLLRSDAAGVHAHERYLCHSPQERLFIDGAWQDGLLPSAEGRPATLAQYRRFAQAVGDAQRTLGFSLPAHRSRWTPEHAALGAQTFAHWLARNGLDDTRLLGYLDYACRDDYGAGIAQVSAWAGLHYFASRHGFHAPGDETAEREPVFTWPEGNAFLIRALAEPLAERLHTGRTVLRVQLQRHGVQVWVHDAAREQIEAWTAETVVLAMPLFIARRLVDGLPPAQADALQAAAAATRYAPWLVANLHLREPLLERVGAPPAWDNVAFAAAGGTATLGYVNARHQALQVDATQSGAQVLTFYQALPESSRAALFHQPAAAWLARLQTEISGLHPDLPHKLVQADLMRWGHAMSIPAPGVHRNVAREALRQVRGRVRFAHADLVGYSVFEEAFTLGTGSVVGLM